ncbi:DUF6116 family protein [Pseudomarimonas salicorniae]|uniref:Uncharacterized protein n=1 Tax=Pseudomarimonas salicorniae TaxID=2933270 RepID=A0ABT0GL73_9GAMM|nr:DUF6116 family protein [Lysobacter sp. CAU 1642]MCK7594780.1 hypothetical protein [Lysobacter sp. CAU 1642]
MRLNPISLLGDYAADLRFPTLFKITLLLALVSWLWPFDPIPFIDEILTALATVLFASWKRERSEKNPPLEHDPPRQ